MQYEPNYTTSLARMSINDNGFSVEHLEVIKLSEAKI